MPKAVIMAGGQGERFWPLTHVGFPKYRIRLQGKQSLLQGTYRRLLAIYRKDDIYVVTTREHARMIHEELPGLKPPRIFIEPTRNNTAAAILLSCALLEKRFGPEETVSFFPADHVIRNTALFKKTVLGTIRLAEKEPMLVTVGIKPTFPATGYGYIEAGAAIRGVPGACRVRRFVEKPNRQKALSYIRRRSFYWNGGIFTWRLGVFLKTMKKHSPEIYNRLNLRDLSRSYRRIPNKSIDFALLERARNIAVFKTRMDWCDMGNWDMFFDQNQADQKGNHKEGAGVLHGSNGSLLVNQSGAPVIALGVSDLVIVQTARGTLICPRGRAEEAAILFKKI